MQQDKEKTEVYFRRFREDGAIIAIFPEIPGDMDPRTCLSYMHIGQHSACDPALLQDVTSIAFGPEVAALKEELEGIGYNLRPAKQGRDQEYLSIRKQELEAIHAAGCPAGLETR